LFTSGRESDGVLIGLEKPDDISASLPVGGVSRFFLGGGAGAGGDAGRNADGRGTATAGSVLACDG